MVRRTSRGPVIERRIAEPARARQARITDGLPSQYVADKENIPSMYVPPRAARDRRRGNMVFEMLPRLDPSRREDCLIAEMIENSLKLLRDGPSLGDVKILNASLRELRYAFKVFAPYRGVRKVSVFGSARTPPGAPTARAAREFAQRIAAEGYMVITGAGLGIMRACQEGAGRERSFGVNIRLPFEQEPNEFIAKDSKLLTFRYFFTRKLMFIKVANAAVLFPGGFGTHDEAYECLTLVQTVEDHLLRPQLISEEDMSLFKVTCSIEEAVEEITRFYRLYHSSRTVGRRLVIRLNRPIAESLVADLSRDFADILVSGRIEQTQGALPAEDEPEITQLPRLILHFNRTHFGRLRQLIDRVNLEG
ncbi:MAG: LOG family protein [Deltaproteobacteria bacterium]|nr:MAG: LOG family protein [Deltaproteobacteria bacterium]